jgi:hypothetical protein
VKQPDAEVSDDRWAGVVPDAEADTGADARANAGVAAEIMAHDLTTMLDEYGMEPGAAPRSSGRPGASRRRTRSQNLRPMTSSLNQRAETSRLAPGSEMTERSVPVDDAYYRYPAGSPEHYAAYQKEFTASDGIDAAVPGDVEASYEADNAWELAYERQNEELERQDVEEQARWWADRGIQVADELLDDPQRWLGDDWYRSIREHSSEPEIELDPF